MKTATIKNLLCVVLLLWGLSYPILTKAGSLPTDSLLQYDYIYNICTIQPQKALDLLDRAEKQGTIPQYKIDHLRSLTYNNGWDMHRMGLVYAQKAYQNDSIRNNPDELLKLLDIMVSQYQEIGNNEESVRYAISGIELARKLGNRTMEANFYLQIGTSKRNMGLKAKAAVYVDHAIKTQVPLAQESKDWSVIDDLIYSYGTKITFAQEDGEYQTAIDLLPAYEELMKKLEQCEDVPQGVIDMRYASEYAAFACIFAQNGEWDKAKQYYEKLLQTEYASTDEGQTIGIEYLLATGRYKEALGYTLNEKQRSRELGDTINYGYLHYVLDYEARAHEGLGNQKAMAKTYRQMLVITDSLHVREKHHAALEFATIYESGEKDAKIRKQATDLQQRNTLLVSLSSIVVLMLILLWYYIHNGQVVKKKNILLVDHINNLTTYKEQLQKVQKELDSMLKASAAKERNEETLNAEDEHSTTQEDNSTLFKQLNQAILDDQLYLNPELSRDELAQIIGVNKNRFAEIIQENTGMNLTAYLNGLKVNHAITLLKKYPNYTLQAIATDSGFNNMGTFHRLFKEKVGMTPSEYKSISLNR